jgi:hypothetical protein
MTDDTTADLRERVNDLEAQIDDLRGEHEQVLGLFDQFKSGQISRRTFLTAVAAVGGVGLMAGQTTAAPSWGSATGNIGTSSTPLNEGYIKTLKSQSIDTDELTGGVTGSLSVRQIYGESIESQSVSSASTVDFVTAINSDYSRYVFELSDVVPAEDQRNFRMQVSTDGGSSWESGSSDYRYAASAVADDGTTFDGGTTGNTRIDLAGGAVADFAGSEPSENIMGTVTISNPANGSVLPLVEWDVSYIDDGGRLIRVSGAGAYKTAEAVDGVRFLFNTGDIESGEFTVLGVMS